MRTLLALLPILTLAACAYDPPMRADHAAPQYQADLRTCQKDGTTAADKRTHAYGYLFLSYPVSYPIVRHQEIRKCMEGKGYPLRS
jgi:hypothetical protein